MGMSLAEVKAQLAASQHEVERLSRLNHQLEAEVAHSRKVAPAFPLPSAPTPTLCQVGDVHKQLRLTRFHGDATVFSPKASLPHTPPRSLALALALALSYVAHSHLAPIGG
jgi:hypothetical protein